MAISHLPYPSSRVRRSCASALDSVGVLFIFQLPATKERLTGLSPLALVSGFRFPGLGSRVSDSPVPRTRNPKPDSYSQQSVHALFVVKTCCRFQNATARFSVEALGSRSDMG